MGKKSKQKDAETRQAAAEVEAKENKQAAIAAREPLRQRVKSRREAIDKKDFANHSDFVANTSVAAQANQRMENSANLTTTGVGGLAMKYATPDSVAMASRLVKDKQAENAGLQYENDVRGFIGETNAMEQDLGNADAGMYSNFSSGAYARAMEQQKIANEIQMRRSSWLPQAIGVGISGFSSIYGAVRPNG